MDIRPEIAPGAIHALVSNFLDPQVGCATGDLILRQQGHDETAHAVGDCYWRYERWLRARESMVDSTVGVYGGFYAVRRKLAVAQPDGLILDDMFQPLRSSAMAIAAWSMSAQLSSTPGRNGMKTNLGARCGPWQGISNWCSARPGSSPGKIAADSSSSPIRA